MPKQPPSVMERALAAALPKASTALVVGPHTQTLLAEIARSIEVVHVIWPGDSTQPAGSSTLGNVKHSSLTVSEWLATNARVDVVICPSGLSDPANFDTQPLPWDDRLRTLHALLAPGGALLAGVERAESTAWHLPKGPAQGANSTDPEGPTSTLRALDAFESAGMRDPQLLCGFGADDWTGPIVDFDILKRSLPAGFAAQLVASYLRSQSGRSPGLEPEQVERLCESELLWTAATRWLIFWGTRAPSILAEQQARPVTAELHDGQWRVTQAAAAGAQPWVDDETRIDDQPNVAAEALRLMHGQDLMGFRSLAADLAGWFSQTRNSSTIRFDAVFHTFPGPGFHDFGQLFGPLPVAERTELGGSKEEAFARAWIALAKEAERRGLPAAATGAELTQRAFAAAGWSLDDSLVAGVGTTTADDKADEKTTKVVDSEAPQVTVRAKLLRSVLAQRDSQLLHRERHIRELRATAIQALNEAESLRGEVSRLRRSNAYRIGRLVEESRHPRDLLKLVVRQTTPRSTALIKRVLRRR